MVKEIFGPQNVSVFQALSFDRNLRIETRSAVCFAVSNDSPTEMPKNPFIPKHVQFIPTLKTKRELMVAVMAG